jgi:hypothetical protein
VSMGAARLNALTAERNAMPLDLYSGDHFNQKNWERVRNAKPEDFGPWEEARERYIAEKVEPMLQMYRQSDHDWFKDFSRRRGECSHSSDFIHKLQGINPHIFVQQQYNFENDWGLYSSALGRVQFLTGLPKGWMTEFSYALVDDRDLPTEERRGWRTCLIYCLMKGAITWEQVLATFGEPQDGFNEERWMSITTDFRHGGDEMVQRNISNILE